MCGMQASRAYKLLIIGKLTQPCAKAPQTRCKACHSTQLCILQSKGAFKDVMARVTGGAAARAELGLADNYYDTSAGQRERMLKTTEKLDKTGDRISQGRAQLAETEAGPSCCFAFQIFTTWLPVYMSASV